VQHNGDAECIGNLGVACRRGSEGELNLFIVSEPDAMSTGNGKVLMANMSAPELTHLAAEFARSGLLTRYVRRYANQNRWWERAIQRLPGAGAVYARTLGLRLPPEGLQARHLEEAGVLQDFAAAIVSRSGLPRRVALRVATALNDSAFRAIGLRAARLAGSAAIVVAGSGTAYPVFKATGGKGIPRVLNYPSAHHRFQRRFFEAVATKQPEFAGLDEAGGSALSLEAEPTLDAECAMADLILTGSRFARQSFIDEGIPPERVLAIPYGVDTERFLPGPQEREDGRFRIVYVGRISQRKGIGYLLQAYQRFRRNDTDLQLTGNIVGDASCLAPYQPLFRHIPHMPNVDLPHVYRNADVFVFPSLLEGLGLVVLEAMACGCPVIVTRNGPEDVVRDGIDGLVVPAGDADALTEALDRMYKNPSLRESMSISARQQAERLNWSTYSAQAATAVLATRASISQ
jgi:glycosyltransferase involved in cell wall biosynthesis